MELFSSFVFAVIVFIAVASNIVNHSYIHSSNRTCELKVKTDPKMRQLRRKDEEPEQKIIYCRYHSIGHDALDDIFVSH